MSETTADKNSLNMFVDYKGIPGVIFCRWIHRRGLAFKIPRHQYRKELLTKFPEEGYDTFRDKGCVYILLGETSEGEGRAYIGESIAIDTRLGTHAFSSKSWNWENVIIFCRNDREFGKEELLYVEEQLIFKAWDADRFVIPNDGKNRRKEPAYTIRDTYKSAADEFVQSIHLLCSALGYTLFEPMPPSKETQQTASTIPVPPDTDAVDLPTFTARSGKNGAKGKLTGDGKTFVVLAGSTIVPAVADSTPETAKEKRKELQDNGVIKDFTFEQDYVFRSAHVATCVVFGANKSANEAWEGLKAYRDDSGDAENQ